MLAVFCRNKKQVGVVISDTLHLDITSSRANRIRDAMQLPSKW